jgi:O-antigen/teichoic acid export membrane protein
MNQTWTRYLPAILREWLVGREQLHKAIGNTGWLLFDRIFRMGVGLVLSAWVARYLGPAQLGELAYVISFLAFFQAASNLEASNFIVRDVAQNPQESSVILGTALWTRLLFGACSWALAVLIVFLLHPAEHRLILLTAIIGATLVFQASDTVDLWFQSQSQSKRTVIARLLSFLFSNGVKVILLVCKAPLIAFAGVMCLEAATMALSLALSYRRFPTESRWRGSIQQAKTLLHLCWPFIVIGFMIAIFSRIDQIMLKEILGERELGIYAAALPFSQAWNIIPTTLVTSLAPFVARKKIQDERQYQDNLVKIFRLFAILAFLGASLTALVAPWIIMVMYGSQYQGSAQILRIHVFSNLFIFQGAAQALWVTNDNVRMVTLLASILAALISVGSNALLIGKFGILGAPFSISIAECVSVVVIPCLFRKDLRDLYKRAFLCMD